jgi:hypothetical protein
LANFEIICEHMVEKFDNKDAKNGNFINQMEFRKKKPNRLFASSLFHHLLSILFVIQKRIFLKLIGFQVVSPWGAEGAFNTESLGRNARR